MRILVESKEGLIRRAPYLLSVHLARPDREGEWKCTRTRNQPMYARSEDLGKENLPTNSPNRAPPGYDNECKTKE